MSKNTNDLAELILAVYPNVRKVFRNLVSLKNLPISMTQLTCLSIIEKQNKLTMSSLANHLNMSNQQLTKVVDSLQEFGLVERQIDEDNRRQVLVTITQQGQKLITSLHEEVDRKLKYVFSRQEEGELDKVYDALSYIAKYFTNE